MKTSWTRSARSWRDTGSEWGWWWSRVDTGVHSQQHEQRLFAAASVYTLALAHEVLRQVDLQALALNQPLTIEPLDAFESESTDLAVGDVLTLRQALEHMLADSSNASAYALMRTVGRGQLNAERGTRACRKQASRCS